MREIKYFSDGVGFIRVWLCVSCVECDVVWRAHRPPVAARTYRLSLEILNLTLKGVSEIVPTFETVFVLACYYAMFV